MLNISTPILFAQIREHSKVEIDAMKSLNNEEFYNICIIASGGDILCDIVSDISNIGKIDVIDCSIDQINLSKLKLALVQKYGGKFVIEFLTNGFKNLDQNNRLCCQAIIKNLFFCDLLDQNAYNYWMDHIYLLEAGVNQNGSFEILFQRLKEEPIEKCFSNDNLTKNIWRKCN